MLTLYYQLCVNSEIYTDRFCSNFPTEFMFDFMITITQIIIQTLLPFEKAKRLQCSIKISTCVRTSLLTAWQLLPNLYVHTNPDIAFFFFFTLAESRQLLIKIALYLELFRFLQFVVKLDKISLCSSSPHISSRREFTALAHHGLFARPGDQIYQAAQITSSSSLSQFAALGETFVGFHTTASSLRGRR